MVMKDKKHSTEQKVLELRKKNPKILAIEIARRLDVSRELVRVYLKRNGLPTRISRKVIHICGDCGGPVKRRSKRCSNCIASNQYVTVACSTCGEDKDVVVGHYRRSTNGGGRYKGRFYCNRICFNNRSRARE